MKKTDDTLDENGFEVIEADLQDIINMMGDRLNEIEKRLEDMDKEIDILVENVFEPRRESMDS